MLGELPPGDPPEPPPGFATSAVPPANKAAVSKVKRAVLPIALLPPREGSLHITPGPPPQRKTLPRWSAAAADDFALDLAAEQGADGGAEDGAGGAAAALVDLAAEQGAGRSADDEAGGAARLAAIEPAVMAAPGLAVIDSGALGEGRRRRERRHGEGGGRGGQDEGTHYKHPLLDEGELVRTLWAAPDPG